MTVGPVPAMIFRRARSASRFTVAQLNFGRESLRDALKRDTKYGLGDNARAAWPSSGWKVMLEEMRSERDAWREQAQRLALPATVNRT